MKTNSALHDIKESINTSEPVKLTVKNVSLRILQVMKTHIGSENGLKQEQLFSKVYFKNLENSLEDWLRWNYIKQALQYIRMNTTCFVVYDRTKKLYFVLKTMEEYTSFFKDVEKIKENLTGIQKRAYDSIFNNWHKKDWVINNEKLNEAYQQLEN